MEVKMFMTKFNPEICAELCRLHSDGLTAKACAAMVGITRRTLSNWLKRGSEAKSGAYRQFWLDWEKANAEYQRYHLVAISRSDSWAAHKYLLEVNEPETFVVEQKIKADTNAKVEAKGELTNLQKFEQMMNRTFGPCKEQEK